MRRRLLLLAVSLACLLWYAAISRLRLPSSPPPKVDSILPPPPTLAAENTASWPAHCVTPMHFISPPRARPIYLASFPGSGNTWLRFLVERGSRTFTGSAYPDDFSLQKQFPGEADRTGRVIAVKTHFPCPKCWTKHNRTLEMQVPILAEDSGVVPGVDRTLFLLRSPLDSFYSEFQFVKTGSHSTALLPEDFLKIPHLLQKKTYKQTEYHNPSWDQFITHRLEAYFESVRVHLTTGQGIPTHVVFYERLVQDVEGEMTRVFAFLKAGFAGGLSSASAEQMAECSALYNGHEKTRFRRNRLVANRGVFNPWSAQQVQRVCDALEPAGAWFKDVWGECRDGLLQIQRDVW